MVHKSSRNLEVRRVAVAPADPGSSTTRIEATYDALLGGAGLLLLYYRGPLTRHRLVCVRLGVRRAGRDWVEPQDVTMTTAGAAAIADITCRAGEDLEGACFAFFTPNNASDGHERWDSAGRPFGYYFFDVHTGLIETR